MDILVINCGSSSIKLDVLDANTGTRAVRVAVQRIGTPECSYTLDETARPLPGADHAAALAAVLPMLIARCDIKAVGHRVVHGGARFEQPTRIDDDALAAIEQLSELAPLHNPANAAGIKAARSLLPELPHVAVFDTAFHATLPKRARHYALPADIAERHGIRRYGFHGPSHQYVASTAAAFLKHDLRSLRVITCHLGNGCSITAVEYGRSVETSMGLTPLEGLVMGTRSGDIDPGALLRIARGEGLDLDGLDRLLNKRSGLAGLSGVGNDLRDIEEQAAEGDPRCRLAIHVFTHRLRKYIGAYAAVMGGVDAVVFTGGIGENSALIRHRALQRMDFLGARLDEDRNRDVVLSAERPVQEISAPSSRVRLLVAKTDEARAIAGATARIAARQDQLDSQPTLPIAVSARHIHLTDAAVEALFGAGHTLTPLKELSQPGQFACEERLTIVGPKRQIERVRVLGPTRRACQVEISRTDEFFLGVDAPVRNSGDVKHSPGVTLIGPAGRLTLEEGLICARRHVHMTPADAARFGVTDKDIVTVQIDSDGRDLSFGDVLVRVSPKYRLEMHLDTDEANAAELRPGHEGVLERTEATAHLVCRSV